MNFLANLWTTIASPFSSFMTPAPKDPNSIPGRAANMLDAMLDELAANLGENHPFLRGMIETVDKVVEEKGEQIISGMEKAALLAAAAKWPILLPVVLKIFPDATPPTPPAPLP
jgi:hypothetical protein